ncbi:MAG: pyridoxal phosphate-dependent aminotransferase [Clostridia bacterium]
MIANKMQSLVANSSAIRAMFEEGKKMAAVVGAENVFDFSLGNPSAEPPAAVKEAILNILSEEPVNLVHGYMNNSGYEDVRKKIAESIQSEFGAAITEDNLIMTVGAAGGLNVIFKTILNPGDEVLTFAPYFAEYRNYCENFNASLTVVPADLNSFQPNLQACEQYITAKTKAVMINTPNNPTGVVYQEAVLRELAQLLLAKEKEFGTDIYLISDEPYRKLAYDGVKIPYVLEMYHNTFVGYSYSKALSLAGERIGYIVANSQMVDFKATMDALNVANRILGFVNAPSLFQRVIGRCLTAEVDVNIYKKNRDLLYQHLIECGFSCIKPEGAFYLFPKAPIADDKAFCNAAKKYNLLLVPGSAFGCPGYFRIAYCTDFDRIQRSLASFSKLAEEFNLSN